MSTYHRILELALKGLQAEKARIEEEIAALEKKLKSGEEESTSVQASRVKRKARRLTASHRTKIADAMKKRWAERRDRRR